jgi:hypothetical protein
LNIGGEHVSARSDAPRNHRLVDPAALQSLADAVLLNAANLSKENQHLDLGIILKGNVKIQVSLICLSYLLVVLLVEISTGKVPLSKESEFSPDI